MVTERKSNAETVTVQTDGGSVTSTRRLGQSGRAGSDHIRGLAAVLPAGIAVLNATAASGVLVDPSPRLACIHHYHAEHIGINGLKGPRRRLVKAVHLEMPSTGPNTNHLRLRRPYTAIDRTTSRILWKISLVLFLLNMAQARRMFAREVGAPTNPVQVPSTLILRRITILRLTCNPTKTHTSRISDLAAPSQVS